MSGFVYNLMQLQAKRMDRLVLPILAFKFCMCA